jgi:hypothetical protein
MGWNFSTFLTGAMAGKSLAGPYQVSCMGGDEAARRGGGTFQTGGGNRIRSVCSAIAAANPTTGKCCSIQQSRKNGSPRNCLGAAGSRARTIRLEANWSSHPFFSNASRGRRGVASGSDAEGNSLLERAVPTPSPGDISSNYTPASSFRAAQLA